MLPLSRNRTYANGDAVQPADLDDLQDQIIALHAALTTAQATIGGLLTDVTDLEAGRHGNKQLLISAAGALANITDSEVTGNFQVSGLWWYVPAYGSLIFDLPLRPGDRVRQVDVLSSIVTAGTRTVELVSNTTGADALSVVASATSTATGDGWKVFDIADAVLLSTAVYGVRYSPGPGSAANVAGIRITYDHP